MKTISSLVLILLSSFAAKSQANWSDSSFVHRSGQNIVSGSGSRLSLEGLNLGGWLEWEGWIWGGEYTTETRIYDSIQSKLGAAAAGNFRDSVYNNFITKADIRSISQQCFNVVRIPFNHTLLMDDSTPFTYKQQGWNILDSILGWCEEYNVYAVIDIHADPGGQSTVFTADPDTATLWQCPLFRQATVSLWRAIAQRYKNRSIIAGYDLLNEPAAPTDSALLAMYKELIDTIRSVDTNHMFFIEGTNSSTKFTAFTSLLDSNMAFEFHFYTWFIANIPSALAAYGTVSANLNAPMWCGEWGENTYPQLDTTLKYLQEPSYNFSGESFWTWKKMEQTGSNYPFYNGIDTESYWVKTIEWIGNPFKPKPTILQMQTGITDFIHDMKLQNCIFNDTLNTILKACTPAGITENKNPKNNIVVFPNPNEGAFTINFGENGKHYIEMDDMLGNKLSWQLCEGRQCNIQQYSLPAGMYFIKVFDGKMQYISSLKTEVLTK